MPPTHSNIHQQPIYPSIKKLRNRYKTALSLIAILIILSQIVMQSLLSNLVHDSDTINLAGRQRMLSQKITKLSYYILSTSSFEQTNRYRSELKKTTALWQTSHDGLINGNKALNLRAKNSTEIKALFAQIEPHFQTMLNITKIVLTTDDKQHLQNTIARLPFSENAFLTGMDKIVFQYAKEANDKVLIAKWTEITLSVIALIVLLLELLFIFTPAATKLQKSLEKLNQHKKDLQNLFAASPIAMLLVDPEDCSILQLNKKASALIGEPFDDNGKKAVLDDYLDANFESNNLFINKLKQGVSLNEYEMVFLTAQGQMHESLISVRNISFKGKSTAVIGITNINELKKAQQELLHYASYDDMSGLLNRRTGIIFLSKVMQQVDRQHNSMCICYIDLDGLKEVNDQYGHAEGDWLIQTLSQTLINIIRTSDAGVRLGGDEFLVILNDCTLDNSKHFITRIESEIIKVNTYHNKPFSLRFSYGITSYNADRKITPDELISESDNLMYQSKQKKKITIFD